MKLKTLAKVCVVALIPLSTAHSADTITKEDAYNTTLESLKSGIPCEMVIPYIKQLYDGMQNGLESGLITKQDFDNHTYGATRATTRYAKDNCPELYKALEAAGG